ncbi:MAG TPA: hypothetical protein VH477_15155 [Bryobacteraceae bacterium]
MRAHRVIATYYSRGTGDSMRKVLLVGFAIALSVSGQDSQQAQSGVPEGYLALLRSDVKTKKTEIIRENVKLSDSEAQKFWPIQRSYENDLSKLKDQRIEIIRDYAKNWDNLSDATAKDLGHRMMDFQKKRLDLHEKYFNRITKEINATVAAKYFQVENQLENLIDLEIASQIPLVK